MESTKRFVFIRSFFNVFADNLKMQVHFKNETNAVFFIVYEVFKSLMDWNMVLRFRKIRKRKYKSLKCESLQYSFGR